MPNDLPTDAYGVDFVGGEHYAYYFITKDEVVYQVRFVPSAYMFEGYIDGHVDAYEMVIAVAHNPSAGRIPADRLTACSSYSIFKIGVFV